MKVLLSGNEAIARGAYEGGLMVASAYPGTPSTEIFENLPLYKDSLYCEWAPNEKVATEMAYGAAIAGVRAMTAMKHVGVNVAADPIFTSAYLGVNGGFVIVSADDPDLHSSQNEQDNRYYAKAAKLAMVEPSDSQECIDFMKEAFEISERFDIPVLFRVTTRICHSKSLVTLSERKEADVSPYKRDPVKYCATPARAKAHHKRLEERLVKMEEYACQSPLNKLEMKSVEVGVITSGVSYQYAKESFPEDTSFLKLGFTNPLPMTLIRDFASKVKKLYVIEELEPFMELQIKAAGIDCVGKDKVPLLYELNPQILDKALFDKTPDTKSTGIDTVVRPPVLCPGCPHRGFYHSIGKHKNFVVAGDIGCYTLGGTSPLNAVDTTICMGAGFSAAAGIAKALMMTGQTDKKVFGVVGDSTFFHSGMTGAAEIIYNKLPVIPCVLDNSITGMTGHQDNPGTGETLMGEQAPLIKIEDVLSAIGFKNIIIVDPQDLKAMDKALKDAAESTVPAAIITRRPCLLIKKIKHDIGTCRVDPQKCRSCKMCLSAGCPAIFMENGKATIDETLCTGCTVCAQICPFGAIERIR
ncbi:MAG: indolepyruvate ferredoxin oxidoreductase subunit alpha [Clostridiaceae bacterium]|nr:indolepyruvate ferredoxin oxidoreductase subunit alpha [Clostridiaceae bacterium]